MNAVHGFSELLSSALGIGAPAHTLAVSQVALRGVVVYLAGIVLVRLAPRRFLARHTPFDVILGIILGAVLARAINGSARLIPTLGVGFALVILDRGMAVATYHWQWIRRLVEGEARLLVRDGEVQPRALARIYLSREDLAAALRRQAGVGEPAEVAEARIERSGEVSVILRRQPA